MSQHDTAELLESVAGFVDRYVEFKSEAQLDTVGLWVLHSWVAEVAYTTPYLAILSPEKRSGKTRLLEVLESLCARPWRMLAPSEAVLYRKLNQDKPTILLDEVDGLFNGATERSEPLRTLLNSGNRRGTTIPRCVGPQFEVKDFEVFGPKVLAGIDNQTFPETVRDRSIVVKMQRKTTHRERWLPREVEHVVGEITAWLDGWADVARDRLGDARPELPTELDDRAAEGWEALLAIADLAGGEWPARARRAALELSAGIDEEEESRGVRLLRDIHNIYEEGAHHSLFTDSLLSSLNSLDESPWGGWNQGQGLQARNLSRTLRPYEIKSRTVRVGSETAKGYLAEQFEDAWGRYLPQASQASQASQPSPRAERDVTDVTDVTDSQGYRNGRVAKLPLGTAAEEAELERIQTKLEVLGGGAS